MDDRLISEDELDTLLAERDPIDLSRLTATSLDSSLALLREDILQPVPGLQASGQPGPAGAGSLPARAVRLRGLRARRRRLSAGVILGSGLAAAGSLAGVSVLGSSSQPVGWMPSVAVAPAQAAELNRLASAATLRAGPGPGQWLFERTDVSEGTGTAAGTIEVNVRDHRAVESWTSANDVQRTRSVYRSFTFDTAKDRANYYGKDHSQFAGSLHGGPGSGTHVTDEADPSLGSSPFAPQNMPSSSLGILRRFKVLFNRDPTDYWKEPRAQQKLQFAANFFGELMTILGDSVSSRQRAAALKDFAYVKGVQMLGTARDAIGRHGIGIRYVWHGGAGQVYTIIIDPKTGDLLQTTMSELRATFPGAQGPVFPVADGQQRTVYLQRAIVNSMTALPGGGSQPYRGIPPTIGSGTGLSRTAKGSK